ncbi:CDGSH iron-sulfur domain-containing protein [Streptomyces sp. SPB4]|uniref:CDGSH iron-sulfur domain-containing protein n=1 Tax=Streptomyces TaxID=1883 RepID=UPI002473DD64|nr:CDGSH iron-sulfur domain-containing protein [Streptomyces sp. SPB4]MDH6544059.1 CDGSH-type Zn-finger protein [Streptomyces sp. SPB4]
MPSAPESVPSPGIVTADARRVAVEPGGPVLVEGPVEILLDDGTVARSDRFMVAVCTCRRSRTYPWCDTSHRRRGQAASPPENRKPA